MIAHAAEDAPGPEKTQDGRSQPVPSKKSYSSHPPQIPVVCQRIGRDWLRGVKETSLSIMYRLTREAVENILREQARLMTAALRHAGAATAMVLVGLCTYDAHEAVVHDDQHAMDRAFRGRGRKGRRRGLEDALKVRVYRIPAQVAA
jgi:hypothetical protein